MNANNNASLGKYFRILKQLDSVKLMGKVSRIVGLMIESIGPPVQIGDICNIYSKSGENSVGAEVIGIKEDKVLLLPLGELNGIGHGSSVVSTNSCITVPVGMELKGRILDGLGNPMDGKGRIVTDTYYEINNMPPNPLSRQKIEDVLPLGVRVLDGILTFGKGQRMGIFAGSGVGKSTLLGMIARNAKADINVIVLVGERGREVSEFIENDLKEEGLKKSVVIVATSDQSALVRLKSPLIGTSIAEYFRDQGLNVLLLVDSLTRFAMAQRDVGLAASEPPVARGYTPSVFAMLPRLLERAGNSDKGCISALYTVLVDGDDMNEPIADAVRGILDGHVVLSRKLANRNHYPAIDVLASVSRVMPAIVSREHLKNAKKLSSSLSIYNDAQDLINIGAYKSGSNEEIDEAIRLNKPINAFLRQQVHEANTFEETVELINNISQTGVSE